MTLIASVFDGTTIFAFGDLLVTKNHRFGGVGNVIPGVWKEDIIPDIHVASLRRKVCSLSPSTIFLWSGTLDVARNLYAELATISNDTNPFKRSRFAAKLEEYRESNVCAQLIFVDLRNVPTLLQVNCQTYNIPKLGSVVIAGSGRDTFLEEVAIGEIASQIAKAETPLHKAAAIEHILLKAALYDASQSVTDRWGGGIETFFSVGGGFIPLDYVVHSFVEVQKIPGGWLAKPHSYTVSKRYLNEGKHYGPKSELVIVEIDRYVPALDLHVVPPIYATNGSRLGIPAFEYASPLSSHYFIGMVSSMRELGASSRTLMIEVSKLTSGLAAENGNNLSFRVPDREVATVIEDYVRDLVDRPTDPKPDRIILW